MMKIKKAVILAAGWGTRMLPFTRAVPKELAPIVDKPAIHYVVEEIVSAGIEHILLVTAAGKGALENYFDRTAELENLLQVKGKKEALERAQSPRKLAHFLYARQQEQLGTGHAVLSAENFVAGEPFVLVLPDDVILSSPTSVVGQMVDIYNRVGGSIVSVQRVPEDSLQNYGVVQAEEFEPNLFRARRFVEKPAPREAPSNLAVVGRYILTPSIFAELRQTAIGLGGELQITDAIQRLAQKEDVFAYEFQGERFDTGQPLGLIMANLAFGLRRPDLRAPLTDYIKGIQR